MSARRGRELALLAGTLLLLLGGLELAVRLFLPGGPARPEEVHPPGLYEESAALGFRMTPGFRGRLVRPEFDLLFELSSLGIRDRERGERDGARRLLVLGDSYTFGWGVEVGERWVDLLEEDLRVLDPRWDVVKAGTNSYATRQELAWLREVGWGLEPEAVLLQFCLGNDFSGNVEGEYHVADGYLRGPAGALREGLGGGDRVAGSRLLGLLRERIFRLREGRTPRRRIRGQIAGFQRSVEEGLPATRALLAEMRDEAAAHGVPLGIVVVPLRHQLYEAAFLGPEITDAPNRELAQVAEELGIPLVDLLPAFRAWTAEKKPRLYFRRDRHWNAAGHRLAADEVFRSIQESGFLALRAGDLPTPGKE